ncbi:MAG: ABC transporter permease, partial [Planctomycetes bacterium]|nr:ABC transporter permease [Planctomycetota bacterium]
MRKILVIAVREYLAAIRTRSFLISLVILPLLMVGSALIQIFLKNLEDTHVKVYAVVDRTPGEQLFPVLQEAARRRGQQRPPEPAAGASDLAAFTLERMSPGGEDPEAATRQHLELSEAVRQGKLAGFLEIGADVFQGSRRESSSPEADDPEALRYQSKAPALDAFPRWAERVVNQEVLAVRCRRAGVPEDRIPRVLQPVPLLERGLSQRNPQTGAVEEASVARQLAPFLVPAGLMMVMFMMIIMGSTPLMQGVVEEKMQRIAEVLLGSARPFTLMLGKLLGMVAVSLTISLVYLGATFYGAFHYGFTEFLPTTVLVWFLAFQVLGVLMYGSLCIAIGAACTDMKETQTLMWPVVLLVCFPLFMIRFIIQEPNSPLVLGLSFFPPATPLLMVARLAVPPGIPWWQPALGMVGVTAATLLCVYAAGRIFRVGLLLQGKGAKVGEMFRW